MNSTLPTVGFDRFISLEWADHALNLAIQGKSSEHLKPWLEERISGKDAARKTSNLLTNIWLRTYPETEHIHKKALTLAQELTTNDYLLLHWGMATANFALFRDTVTVLGRFLRLQGQIQAKEIKQRILEKYHNQGTIPRSVGRILQSLNDWGVLEQVDSRNYKIPNQILITNNQVLVWLIETVLLSYGTTKMPYSDLIRISTLFPFDIATHGILAVRESNDLIVSREGLDQEYISLRK